MEQIEIILRTTTPSGKVTEQLLAKFDTEKPVIESDKVLQYSGLHIDPDKHQVSYQGSVLPLTETYEFQTFVYLSSPVSQGESIRKNRSIRQSGKKSLWM